MPPSPRYEPLPLRPDERLENQIRVYLGKDIDSYGVVVKRLSDGAGVAINADQEFYAASLFKILVMFEVFKQRELQLLSFDEMLTFTPPYLDYELGPPRWPVWSQISVRDLVEAMITESDNVAAMMLHDRTGGWNIIADYRAIGLKHTDIASDEFPTSAGDMALWLEMIAHGKAVDERSGQEMIDLLARQKINDRLPSLLPAGTRVAHKTGNWDNATHDVGVVYAPRGAYVIAVLSDKAWETKPIAELSRLVYEHFERQSGR
ncbi:MAG: serine hydrolase [Chloroflexi bacterium]|nr:serine hydrolase [Chloroflexota bacterium]